MPKLAILFGFLLIVLGVVAYFGSDLTSGEGEASSPAAEESSAESTEQESGDEAAGGKKRSAMTGLIIPASFGVLLLISGLIGLNEAARKHAMHAAASIGLLGAVATIGKGSYDLYKLVSGMDVNPRAMTFVWAMAAICTVFVGLCIQSFISARRRQQQE